MTTFISLLIWVALIVLIVLCVRSLILKVLEIRDKKKKDNINTEDKKENDKKEENI